MFISFRGYLAFSSSLISYREFEKNITSGGPPKDGIPPIDNPKYVSIKKANKQLKDNDIVFVVDAGSEVKIFPQNILVWHKIVNDTVAGKKSL